MPDPSQPTPPPTWLDQPPTATAAGAAFSQRGMVPSGDPLAPELPIKRVGDYLTCPADGCHGHPTATDVILHLTHIAHRRIAYIMETVDQLTADAAAEAEANQAERDASAKFRTDALAAFARLEQAIIDAGQITGTPADVQAAMDALGQQLRTETAAEQAETTELAADDATAEAEQPAPVTPAEPAPADAAPTE